MMAKYKTSGGTIVDVNIKDAEGVRGFILGDAFGHGIRFRVYDPEDKSKFTDYAVAHSDLEVTIHDGASLWEYADGRRNLDHSPAALGCKKVEEDHEA